MSNETLISALINSDIPEVLFGDLIENDIIGKKDTGILRLNELQSITRAQDENILSYLRDVGANKEHIARVDEMTCELKAAAEKEGFYEGFYAALKYLFSGNETKEQTT